MADRYKLSLFQRGFNSWVKLWVRLGLPPRKYHLMTVIGRRSGHPHTIPVSMVEQNGQHWLVCPYGEREWVKNVRAAGQLTLSRGLINRGWMKKRLNAIEEHDPNRSGPVLQAYYRGEPITRKFFRAKANSSLKEFAAEAALHPVFRLAESEGN